MFALASIVRPAAWAVCTLTLCACGQKGDLMLPTGTQAAGRLTLPQIIRPASAASSPTQGAASADPAPGNSAPLRPTQNPTGTASPISTQ